MRSRPDVETIVSVERHGEYVLLTKSQALLAATSAFMQLVTLMESPREEEGILSQAVRSPAEVEHHKTLGL